MKSFTSRAHGRVNLIGEHTDYNGGWVLPTLIPELTQVKITPLLGREVKCTSDQFPQERRFVLGEESLTETWIDYIQGCTKTLRNLGFHVGGFSLDVRSNIPVGSGLSSSAALEISFLKALREVFSLQLTDVDLAKIGQKAENDFVGARVGIMDQMACALAKEGSAFFLDTKTLRYEQIPLCLDKMEILVMHTGITHQHAGGEYNQRRAQCEEACKLLGVSELRELETKDLLKLEKLPELLQKRARHVITENARVHSAVEALKAQDPEALGRLFNESHRSMSKDYEVSLPEIDELVGRCLGKRQVFGARLTGGGFGGSIVVLAEKGTRELFPGEKATRIGASPAPSPGG